MRTGTVRLAAALAAVLMAALAPAAAPAAVRVGVQIADPAPGTPDTAIDHQLDLVRATGARTVRVSADWSEIEPGVKGQRDPAAMAPLDHTMAAARARGMRVVLMVFGTPCWASSAPGAPAACSADSSRYPPRDPADFVPVATFLAGRYQADLAAFEVWNEPDQSNEKYFAGPDKARRYAALARAVYRPLKAAAPKVPVIAGAFVGNDGRFLRALYKAGFKGNYDALSVHFYDLTLFGVRRTRAVQRAAGDHAPMWIAETGWSSCAPARNSPDGHLCVDQQLQARFTEDLIREVRRASYIRGLVIYALQDSTNDEFGLIDRSGAPKPLYAAVRRALGRHPRPITPVSVSLHRQGARLVATGTGPSADALTLTASENGRARYRFRFRLNGAGRYGVTLPAALGVHGVSVRVVQEWMRRPATARIR